MNLIGTGLVLASIGWSPGAIGLILVRAGRSFHPVSGVGAFLDLPVAFRVSLASVHP